MSDTAAFEDAQAVADAILYEGYLLYPYRRSSEKNRVRWQFGVLAPPNWLSPQARSDRSIAGSAEGCIQQTECLLEASEDARLHLRLRFLHVQCRQVQRVNAEGDFEPVDTLTAAGIRYLSFDDAVPREHDVETTVGELIRAPRIIGIDVAGGEDVDVLPDGVGRVVRSRESLSARLTLSITLASAPFPLWRLQLVTENTNDSTPPGTPRHAALRTSLIAAHTLIGVVGGKFLSLLNPPEWATPAAKACRNVHTFPVLAGAAGRRDLMLSSPILMEDHPQVSPESPGDLFDATEIDEILSLRAGTLTEEEKEEARATDPLAAAIIDRVDGLPREVLERLHGAMRSMRPKRSQPPDSVNVDGVEVLKGSWVRLQPRRHGTDAHDIFLAGRTAVVEAVLLDTDDVYRIAVTLDDDPGSDLHQWYGRFYYFSPDEVVPLSSQRAQDHQEV